MDLVEAIGGSAPALLIHRSVWLFPIANAAHVFGVALLFGAMAVVDLRLLGAWRRTPPALPLAMLLPVAWTGFALAVPSGLAMLVSDPGEYLTHPLFITKMALILLAGLNLVAVRRPLRRWLAGTASGEAPPLAVRAGAGLSLALWAGVVTLGRFVAYF